jgi:hypothetical protein
MKARRFVVAGDLHGNWQDSRTVDAILSFNNAFRPQIRVFNGDLWDLAALRRGASAQDESTPLDADILAGETFGRAFFKGGTENHFLIGNHETRLWGLLDHPNEKIKGFARGCIEDFNTSMKAWGCKVLPYDAEHGILELGHLRVVHGYFHGAAAGRNHALTYDNVLYGHTHQIDVTPIPDRKAAEARGIGCLCVRDIPYMKAKPGKLKWGNGWAYGIVRSDGTYDVFQARKVDGRFTVATEFLRL